MKNQDQTLLCIRKQPGTDPEIVTVENSMKALQDAVGGRIETVTLSPSICIIANAEGMEKELPLHMAMGETWAGPVLLVGVSGEQFVSLPSAKIMTYLRAI